MSDGGPRYHEISPTGLVARYVRCIWRLTGRGDGVRTEPIVPDGCGEIVLHAGDPFVQRNANGSLTEQPHAVVVAQLSRAMEIGPTGRIDVWGIRFHPWASSSFLGVPAHELCDRAYGLDDIHQS